MSLLATLDLQGAQLTAASTRGQDVSLAAGAGSGKTRTLVARYLSLLEEGLEPRAIAAITFTEKAAREMRNRIRQEIHHWASGACPLEKRQRWQEIEADVDAARIGTIHSLCAAILRAHPAEAQVDPRFEVMEEGQAAILKAQAVEDALAWALNQVDLAILFQVFETGELHQICQFLIEHRLEASQVIRAGLGTVWNQALGDALTHFVHTVGDCVGELQDLTDSGALEEDAGDRLAAQVEGLLAQWNKVERALANCDLIGAAQALFALRREYCNGQAGKKTSRAKAAIKEFRERYNADVQPWLGGKDKDDAPPDAPLEARAQDAACRLTILFQHALEDYQEQKDQNRRLDFDDLEDGAVRLLRDPAIRARWQEEISAVLVDEFQDTNERQREIVEALTGVEEGCRGRLFVVGDAKQSIYRFRGADVTVFRRLDQDIRARGGLPLELNRTYRAHGRLVYALNEILGAVMGGDEDPKQQYRVPFAELQPDRKNPRPGVREPYIELLYGLGESGEESAEVEANLLARRLHELREEERIDWQDIALLFRASTGFPRYEAALEAAGIPFVTVAGRGFYDRPEIRDLLNILRALADPWDDLAMAGLLRSPAFGLSDAALYLLRRPGGAEPVSFRAALSGDLSRLSESDRAKVKRGRDLFDPLWGLVDRVPVAELLKQVIQATHYPAILAADKTGSRLQRNVDKLLADAYRSGLVRVSEFLEYIETLLTVGAREGEAPTEAGGSLRLMTVHRAKGLQFPVVVLADASRGRPPFRDPVLLSRDFGITCFPRRLERAPLVFGLAKAVEKDRAEAEDLRLLYVAATRVQEKLIVCGHQRQDRSKPWFDQLATAACLNPDLLIETGDWTTVSLPRSGQGVRVLVQSAKAAPSAQPPAQQSSGISSETPSVYRFPSVDPGDIKFYEPLQVKPRGQSDEKQDPLETRFKRARRVIGQYRRPDGTVLGTCVHAALRRWCFPGDPRLDSLLRTAMLEEGLVEAEEVELTQREAVGLLSRLRADTRWEEMDAAERRHEVPYSVCTSSGVSTGYIDLMYRPESGCWNIVEFKTEAVANEPDLKTLLKGKPGNQVRRYREVVQGLLKEPVQAWLCFLNYDGAVKWEPVA